MKLSIFTSMSDPHRRGDNYLDAISCYKDLADELIVVDGSYMPLSPALKGTGATMVNKIWPPEFSWEFIGEQFQRGYESCTGDWVIHADLDFLFHEKDFGKIRQALQEYPNAPAVSFYKWQFILPDRYNLKSRLMLAVNRKAFGARLSFSGGGDLCQPQLDGKDLDINEIPQAGVAFYNYEKLTKTKDQIINDVERMDRAYEKQFGRKLYSNDTRTAWEGWLEMARGRFLKPQRNIQIEDHPKYIQQTIKNLKPEQWGYSGFNTLEKNHYAV